MNKSSISIIEAEHSEEINESCAESGNATNYRQLYENALSIIQDLESKCMKLNCDSSQIESRLNQMLAEKSDVQKLNTELANEKEAIRKEQDAMVMRYASSEKRLLEFKYRAEQFEKKYKDSLKEHEVLSHRIQTALAEKSRICQLLDDKTYQCKMVIHESEKLKADVSALENKVKWSQTNLQSEMDANKKSAEQIERLTKQLQELSNGIEETKRTASKSIKDFQISEENRAYALDKQLKEEQASMILVKHDRDEKERQVKGLEFQLNKLQEKYEALVVENNALSVKVQNVERERFESEQKLAEARIVCERQRQEEADLQSKTAHMVQLDISVKNLQAQLSSCQANIDLLKTRNSELETDMALCREKEAELLFFTQQLTEKNVALQSEFSSLETKVQQLRCENTSLKRLAKEQETQCTFVTAQLADDREKYQEENNALLEQLKIANEQCTRLHQDIADQRGENVVIKRKLELCLKEARKELAKYREQLEPLESEKMANTNNLNVNGDSRCSCNESVESSTSSCAEIDKETLIKHIVKLHQTNAKHCDKIEFLESHVNTLMAEVQHKAKIIQSLGHKNSSALDHNRKVKLDSARSVLALWCNMWTDNVKSEDTEDFISLNHKLRIVLQDVVMQNISLKNNLIILGKEVESLNRSRS